MDNQTYLIESERTEKKFPEGLAIPAKQHHELLTLFSVFIDTAQRIDQLKKQIIYTDSRNPTDVVVRLNPMQAEMLHALMGMSGEMGEILSEIGTNLTVNDSVAVQKEMGDFRWYEAILYRLLRTTQEAVQDMNIRKLRARYPDKYSNEAATIRDTEAEDRAVREGLSNV